MYSWEWIIPVREFNGYLAIVKSALLFLRAKKIFWFAHYYYTFTDNKLTHKRYKILHNIQLYFDFLILSFWTLFKLNLSFIQCKAVTIWNNEIDSKDQELK